MKLRSALAALLVAAVTAGCAHQSQALSAENARKAYAVGLQLAAQDRAQAAEHRAEMAELAHVDVLRVTDAGRSLKLLLRISNRKAKAISSIVADVEVDRPDGQRLGLAEVSQAERVPSLHSVVAWVPIRYLRFGEDAGTVRLAAGRPKHVRLDLTELRYSDGSDAGFDD